LTVEFKKEFFGVTLIIRAQSALPCNRMTRVLPASMATESFIAGCHAVEKHRRGQLADIAVFAVVRAKVGEYLGVHQPRSEVLVVHLAANGFLGDE
jgi:hypothetical protein